MNDKVSEKVQIEKSLDESLILHIISVSELLRKKGDLICQRFGVTTQQWLILLHLANDPNIPVFEKSEASKKLLPSELADSLGVSRPNITNIINILVQKGLVIHKDDEIDRRRRYISLTEKGIDVINQIEPFRRKANMALLSNFNDSQKELILKLLEDCNDYLSR